MRPALVNNCSSGGRGPIVRTGRDVRCHTLLGWGIQEKLYLVSFGIVLSVAFGLFEGRLGTSV